MPVRDTQLIGSAAAIMGLIGRIRRSDPETIAQAFMALARQVDVQDRRFHTLQKAVGRELPILGIDGSHLNELSVGRAALELAIITTAYIADASITDAKIITLNAAKITAGFLDVARLLVGSIDTTKLNVLPIMLFNIPFSNNSPGAGSISWPGTGAVYVSGVGYPISSGNTTSKFVWWNLGAGSFSSGDIFTPVEGRYPIATNVAGIYEQVWNKLGAKVIAESHLSFPLNTPYTPVAVDALSVILNNTAGTNVDTDIVNVSQDGVLGSIGFSIEQRTEDSGNTGSVLNLYVGIQIDGQTALLYQIYANQNPQSTLAFDRKLYEVAVDHEGLGDAQNDVLTLGFGFPYRNSLRVFVRLNRTNTVFNPPGMTMHFSVQRGQRIPS
jgi:hypothetical protein